MIDRFKIPDTYAVWSKNEKIRFISTSGGAFSEFAKVIIENKGIVVGAEYNKDNMVEHAVARNIQELEKLRQSKYISSSLGNIYRSVKTELLEGHIVGFCGAPCQIAGLYSFLGRDYDNLITMDFICRGMNSPKAFRAWLDEIEKKEESKVTRVWFKYKEGGWKSSPKRTRLDFENGCYVILEDEKNLFMHGYLTSNLYIRPSCGECKFKGIPRQADITFADFWGIESELDDDKGTSLLLINSEKGRKIFQEARKNLNIYKKDFNCILAGNPMFTESVVVPENSYSFLKDLDNMKFSDAIKKYTTIPIWKKIVRKISKRCKFVITKR